MVGPHSSNSSIPEFTRYAALGAASFVINLGLAAIFHEVLAMAEWLAVAVVGGCFIFVHSVCDQFFSSKVRGFQVAR
jgi:putative flippase GtrA